MEIDGEVRWVVEPKRLQRMTTAQFIMGHMNELARKIAPVGTETLKKYERDYILHISRVVDDESAKAWVREFARVKSDAYLSDGGFLRRDVSERLNRHGHNCGARVRVSQDRPAHGQLARSQASQARGPTRGRNDARWDFDAARAVREGTGRAPGGATTHATELDCLL